MSGDWRLDQQRRYARQIMLAEVGDVGQRTLLNARVLVVGAGGLGSAVLTYLAAAGVGHLGIIDPDRVELSNLARQIIHETGDIGRLKVESASDRIAEINPEIEVTAYPFALTETTVDAVLGGAATPSPEIVNYDFGLSQGRGIQAPRTSPFHNYVANSTSRETSPLGEVENPSGFSGEGYHLIADGCDNFATRFITNRACLARKLPLVSAAVASWHGQVMTIAPHLATASGCYQCLVNPEAPEANTCRESGIIGPLAGIIGAMQALEVVNALLGRPALLGKLARYDAQQMSQRISHLPRDMACPACGALPPAPTDVIATL